MPARLRMKRPEREIYREPYQVEVLRQQLDRHDIESEDFRRKLCDDLLAAVVTAFGLSNSFSDFLTVIEHPEVDRDVLKMLLKQSEDIIESAAIRQVRQIVLTAMVRQFGTSTILVTFLEYFEVNDEQRRIIKAIAKAINDYKEWDCPDARRFMAAKIRGED